MQHLLQQAGCNLGCAHTGCSLESYPFQEAVRLVLESASLSDASLEGSPTAQTRAASEHMAVYLTAAWQPVSTAWKTRHKHQLRASALILQAWLHAPPAALARLQGDKARYDP